MHCLKNHLFICFICAIVFTILSSCDSTDQQPEYTLYPAPQEQQINPDTHLKITFDSPPRIGKEGKIKIFDLANDSLVDELDLSIPPGPTKPNKNPEATYTPQPYEYGKSRLTNANTKPGTPSGMALPTADTFQLTIIGGFPDGFHFYPVITHENTATIYLHHNLLAYGKEYYVTIDSTVLSPSQGTFEGIYDKNTWQFSTKTEQPNLEDHQLVVDHTGKGDFNTLQGAIDFVPDNDADTVTIQVKNGLYEELIYFRNKSNLIIQGESKEGVTVQYANNEVFNPHPWNIKTNEWPGSFPSRRAAFAVDHCTNIQLKDLTIKTLLEGQAEGLLINGDKIFVKNVHIVGSGDALQTNGPAYFEDVRIDGGGDMILGRGPAFFKNCDFYSPGPFMWIRNTEANHGNVFVHCSFTGTRDGGSELARAPDNKGYTYPYSEAVLIDCSLKNIVPKGWGDVGGETNHIRYWEYQSTRIEDGQPVDVSQRPAYSRQLQKGKDQQLINNYTNPAFVLDGWNPADQ